jgi:adenosylmethionine-8-amino-7-oxononanoate aminotransferase
MPLSVVLFTNEIYNAFYCDYNEGKSFLDSHSYTGNTLACATANAVLDIFERENVIETNQSKIALMAQETLKFIDLENVKEVRQRGMICAIELEGYAPQERIGLKIFQAALQEGVYIRPLGHVIYFMPPYCFSDDELMKMINTTYLIVSRMIKA